MMEDAHIAVEDDGNIGIVTLDRASKLNAISSGTIAKIGAIFSDPPPYWKAAIIRAAGDNFSAGLDLSEHSQRDADDVLDVSRLWHRSTETILNGSIPVIAVLKGYTIGGGLELAASTHIRIAEESARYSLPEGRRGIFVGGGGSVRIGRLIGASRLMELMLTGREIDAVEGHRIGLSHMLVETGAGMDRALEIARVVAQNPPQANRMIISALPQIADMPLSAGLFAESVVVSLAQRHPEAKERLDSFLAKRSR
jgi:enoyl-CoA hydratase/carnithine racemase